jgi:hypothetical protein
MLAFPAGTGSWRPDLSPALPDTDFFPPARMGFPHAVQNLLPGGADAPQDEHFSTFRGPPQEEQNFPEASAPQDGHFIASDTPNHALDRAFLPEGIGVPSNNLAW